MFSISMEIDESCHCRYCKEERKIAFNEETYYLFCTNCKNDLGYIGDMLNTIRYHIAQKKKEIEGK